MRRITLLVLFVLGAPMISVAKKSRPVQVHLQSSSATMDEWRVLPSLTNGVRKENAVISWLCRSESPLPTPGLDDMPKEDKNIHRAIDSIRMQSYQQGENRFCKGGKAPTNKQNEKMLDVLTKDVYVHLSHLYLMAQYPDMFPGGTWLKLYKALQDRLYMTVHQAALVMVKISLPNHDIYHLAVEGAKYAEAFFKGGMKKIPRDIEVRHILPVWILIIKSEQDQKRWERAKKSGWVRKRWERAKMAYWGWREKREIKRGVQQGTPEWIRGKFLKYVTTRKSARRGFSVLDAIMEFKAREMDKAAGTDVDGDSTVASETTDSSSTVV